MVKEGRYFYVVITGDSATHTYLPIKRSTDLRHWTELGPVFRNLPAWVSQQLATTPADAWAPELNYVHGHWALYYAASQFGTQNSVIGLATTKTLDPASPDYGWVDRGLVLRSSAGDSFNAIDPNYTTDAEGRAWLSFGSFWGGIKMRRLDPVSGKLSASDPTLYSLASRVAPDAEEGPSIVRHGRHYYLFLAFDFCCRGVNSDYRVMVGRSTSITGPYVDRAGVRLLDGGGTEVLRGYNEFIGTGGADVTSVPAPSTGPRHPGIDYFVNHYYDATDDGAPKLNVRRLSWHRGWPQVSDPVNPSRSIGHGEAYLKIVSRSSAKVVTDVGCGYEGANIALAPEDREQDQHSSCQQWQLVGRGDGASSILNRFSNKVAEVAGCDNVDGGNVAQWGWLGYLPNNDCQRWSSVAAQRGWTTIQTVLPGSRVMDVAGCGTSPGTKIGSSGTKIGSSGTNTGSAEANIDIRRRLNNACQQFRLQPVGRVLLADPTNPTRALGVAGCTRGHGRGTRVRDERRSSKACQEWRFTSAGGATYVVTNVATGCALTAPGTALHSSGTGARLSRGHGRTAERLWTLLSNNDGSWALKSLKTGATLRVKILIP